METDHGDVELFVRALEGFPERGDSGFGLSDVKYACVELVLRFIPHNGDASDARFTRLTRSLGDIVQLEKHMNGSLHSQSEHPTTSAVMKIINGYEIALSRPRFGSISQQTDRLMWQLEALLTETLTHSSHLSAVKAFFGHQIVISAKHGDVVERCLAGARDIQETTIGSGCSHHENVEFDGLEPSLLVWKFAVDDESTADFSVVWRPVGESGGDAVDVDPYSVEAIEGAQDETEHDEDKQLALQYPTQYTSVGRWVYGACIVPGGIGAATLEWTNADTTSIESKHLQFQVVSISASERAYNADADSLWQLFSHHGGADNSEPLAWLKAIVEASSEAGWPVDQAGSDDVEGIKIDDAEDTGGGDHQQSSTIQKDLRVLELEGKVMSLEEELQTVRHELKGARSELEISSEIYKASLETITQLETKAPVARQQSRRDTTNRKASFDDIFNSDNEDEDDDEEEEETDEFNLDSEDEAESEPVDAETNRLRGLVATFQEQCLWRSIETTESEKRGLLLELELTRVDDQVTSLTATLAEKDVELEALRSENQKLKAQKSVLVKEVKRLQPYSQVNLATLIHEAEEARMMQRSLQAQLNALMAGPPETEHPQS